MRRTLRAIALLGMVLCIATAGVVATGPGEGNGSAPTDAPPENPGKPTETTTPTATAASPTATATPTSDVSTPTPTAAPKLNLEDEETDGGWWDIDPPWAWDLGGIFDWGITDRLSEFVEGLGDD